MKRIRPLRRAVLRLRHGKPYVKSYSQLGEDMVVRHVFRKLGIARPTYIDIGANDPLRFNNTALLYETGSRGVTIEPDPAVFKEIVRKRTRDINLNIGISDANGEADFYRCNDDKLSTFSKEEAGRVTRKTPALSFEVMKIPTRTIDSVIAEYCGGAFPDFLSLDVEGLDYTVLKSIDYEKSAPKVICVETAHAYDEIDRLLTSKGYTGLSTTFLNTIYCNTVLWENR
ncbi:MAG: FkbM family methyltransferase [Patescibacteria group bacterium]